MSLQGGTDRGTDGEDGEGAAGARLALRDCDRWKQQHCPVGPKMPRSKARDGNMGRAAAAGLRFPRPLKTAATLTCDTRAQQPELTPHAPRAGGGGTTF